jgi:signal transduction histidine kinase
MRSGSESEDHFEQVPDDEQLTLSQIELIERIDWLINLRWLAFVGVIATILVARAAFAGPLPCGKLLAVAFAIPAYNLVYHIAWRRATRSRDGNLEHLSSLLANAQILCDLIVLGALIHFSGGVENLFGFYFVFHMVIASFLLSRRAAFMQATFAIGIFTAIVVGEYHGLLAHYISPIGAQVPGMHSSGMTVFAAVWVMATSLYVAVFFGTTIAARLRRREDEVTSLSRVLTQSADMLRAACEQLDETAKAKSAYARKVAHELRSPLAAIDSLLRVVDDGLRGEVSEPARQTIARARHRTHGLLAVVHDLLVLAAAREAPQSSEFVQLDLRPVLDSVVGLLTPQAETRGIKIDTHVPTDPPLVCGDPESMEELFTNLVRNAVKYSHDGGVVQVRMSSDAGYVRVEVADNGIGIDEEEACHIFDEFYRSTGAREFTPDGTGLGLAIAKTIVDAHGGAIRVESRKGEGARFIVCLPVACGKSPAVGAKDWDDRPCDRT